MCGFELLGVIGRTTFFFFQVCQREFGSNVEILKMLQTFVLTRVINSRMGGGGGGEGGA